MVGSVRVGGLGTSGPRDARSGNGAFLGVGGLATVYSRIGSDCWHPTSPITTPTTKQRTVRRIQVGRCVCTSAEEVGETTASGSTTRLGRMGHVSDGNQVGPGGAQLFPVVRTTGQESNGHPASWIRRREGEMPPDAGPKLGCFTSLNILTSIRTPSLDYICYPL